MRIKKRKEEQERKKKREREKEKKKKGTFLNIVKKNGIKIGRESVWFAERSNHF